MSNMPDVTKRKVSLQIPIATIMKIDKISLASGLSRNEVSSAMLDKATSAVVLDDDDIEKINAEIRKNRKNREKRIKVQMRRTKRDKQ